MNNQEKAMVKLLIELRKNYDVVGIKTEFEAEGVRFDEFHRLKEMTMLAELPITLKIGGAEALSDIYFGKSIGISHLVAPMIESAFAVKKFVSAITDAYMSDEIEDIVPEINVETITGHNNFSEMLALPEYTKLGGVVIGRMDMVHSMGLTNEDVDSDVVFTVCNNIFHSSKEKYPEKTCTLGGISNFALLDFFKRFAPGIIDRYEQRKVIYAFHDNSDSKIKKGLIKGLEFEVMWYENKSHYYNKISTEDKRYVESIQNKLKKMQMQI
jgi:hypothetical protein